MLTGVHMHTGDFFDYHGVEYAAEDGRGDRVRAPSKGQVSELVTPTSASVAAMERAFDRMVYWLRVPKTSFDMDAFRRSLPADAGAAEFLQAAPRAAERGRYSILCSWIEFSDDVEFNIEFVNEAWPHAPNEREPFAEEFVPWLGQFAQEQTVRSHQHSRFIFRLSAMDPAFPLELSTTLPSGVTLNGVSLRLSENAEGVLTVQILRGSADWFVELVAERSLTFSHFDVNDDIDASLSAIRRFLVERET